MKKAIFFILVAGLAIPGLVKAQSGYTSFQYQIGFGMGDLGDYISKTSFRGAVFEYQKNMTSNISVGLELAWNTFYTFRRYPALVRVFCDINILTPRKTKGVAIGREVPM